jgi:hypothetical protein
VADELHLAHGWDEQITGYHFGPDHPLAPVRVEPTMQLAYQFGLWNQPGVTVAAQSKPPTRTCCLCTRLPAAGLARPVAVGGQRGHPLRAQPGAGVILVLEGAVIA